MSDWLIPVSIMSCLQIFEKSVESRTVLVSVAGRGSSPLDAASISARVTTPVPGLAGKRVSHDESDLFCVQYAYCIVTAGERRLPSGGSYPGRPE